MRLTALEAQVLAKIVESYPAISDILSAQLAASRPRERRFSGKGFFLELDAGGPEFATPNFELGDVHADLEGIDHGVGLILFVRRGRIDWLEGFTYGEEWPKDERIKRVYFELARRSPTQA